MTGQNGQKRILIADDDPKVRFILQATLERMGREYEIVAVQDGPEALAKVESESFDLIIADIRMPAIDGIQFVETIRSWGKDTVVIWITAFGCHRLQAERERLHVYRCLDKPLRIGEIRQVALDALGSREASAEQPDPDPENVQACQCGSAEDLRPATLGL